MKMRKVDKYPIKVAVLRRDKIFFPHPPSLTNTKSSRESI
jgi:hypothetical protein